MNLNSYIALMGGSYHEAKCAWGTGTLLRKSPGGALHFRTRRSSSHSTPTACSPPITHRDLRT